MRDNMNKTIAAFFLFGILLFSSCGSGNGNVPEVSNASKETVADQLAGDWVSKQFIDSLLRTRSPRCCTYQDIIGFNLDKDNLLSLSPVLNGYTEHEGGYSLSLLFDTVVKTFEHHTSIDDNSYSRDSIRIVYVNDKLINLFNYSSGTDNFFLRMPDIDRAINSSLLSGNYVEKNDSDIVLNPDGSVSGFGDLRYYYVNYDFNLSPNFDMISFRKKKENVPDSSFHFKFVGDTMFLYTVLGDFPDQKIGKLAHKLILTN